MRGMRLGSFGIVMSLLGLVAGLAIGLGPVRTAAMNDPSRHVTKYLLLPDKHHLYTGEPFVGECKKIFGCKPVHIPLSPMPLVYRSAGIGLLAGMLYAVLVSWVGQIRPRRWSAKWPRASRHRRGCGA